jgi:4-hydroxy-tetrahydrodipicolinate synthase
MLAYSKSTARTWARQALRGVANVIIPSFKNDLSGLNETGIRHDVRVNIQNGFMGALLVSDVAITMDEYEQFCMWVHDEAGDAMMPIYHPAFSTLEQNVQGARIAEKRGAQLCLLTYPASLYAESEDDIFAYTKAFCDATDLAVMLFPVPLWGFARIHPSDISSGLIRRMLDTCPNIVAIKAEGGYPSIMGFVECYRLFNDEVVISCPIEGDMIPLSQLVPIQFSATSNAEYFGPTIPHVFNLLQEGDFAKATEIYWRVHPARKANQASSASVVGMGLINRLQWKYQAWLNGYSGGPLRQPTMRVNDQLMSMLRAGLVQSGIEPTASPNQDFFIGRYPTS